MRFLAVLVLIGLVQYGEGVTKSLHIQQLRGIKKMLKGVTTGVYPTCNMVLFSELTDYFTADEHCKAFDMGTGRAEVGNLATVDDSDKNEDLKLLLQMAFPGKYKKWADEEWVWAGLRKTRNNVGKLTDETREYNTEDWEWADGSNPTEFHKWMATMPDQKFWKYGKGDCAELDGCSQNQMRINHDGKWDDTFAFKTHPYVCDYHGKYLISPTHKSWYEARATCEEAGLVLAEVRNHAEVEEIVSLSEYFLGAYDNSTRIFDNSNWIWTGGNDLNEEGEWRWISGDSAKWNGMPWRTPQPDDASFALDEGEDVLAISRWGQFDDSFSLRRHRPFACMCPDA